MCHSRQIRPPIYSLKQSKLRKRRTIRYAMLYFTLFLIFIVLIVAPMIAGKYVPQISIPMNLLQPTGLNNNDTTSQTTGTAVNGPTDGGAAATDAAAATSEAARRFAHFMY
jgi:1,3-beta-glucan synthase